MSLKKWVVGKLLSFSGFGLFSGVDVRGISFFEVTQLDHPNARKKPSKKGHEGKSLGE